jgi:hypothetical protein
LHGGVSESNQLLRNPFPSVTASLRLNRVLISLYPAKAELGIEHISRIKVKKPWDPIANSFYWNLHEENSQVITAKDPNSISLGSSIISSCQCINMSCRTKDVLHFFLNIQKKSIKAAIWFSIVLDQARSSNEIASLCPRTCVKT